MEQLTLIAAPENLESYNNRSYTTRKRLYKPRSEDEWIEFLASEDVEIRWVVRWWRIRQMMTAKNGDSMLISGLRQLTFYFPTRILRQYGRKQIIPEHDVRKPLSRSMVGQVLKIWEKFWAGLPRWDVLDLDARDTTISSFYKKWMRASTVAARNDLRAAEKHFLKRTGTDSIAESSSRTRTNLVKNRLGPTSVPIWERLGPAEKAIEKKGLARRKWKKVLVDKEVAEKEQEKKD